MRIGFDVNPLIAHGHRGIGQTTFAMARSLLEATLLGEGDSYRLRLYIDRQYTEQLDGGGHALLAPFANRTDRARPAVLRAVAAPAELPAQAGRDGLDLLHLNDYFFPLYRAEDVCSGAFRPTRLVLTVRDIFPLLFPDQNVAGCQRLKANLLPLLDQVDQIVAISAWTREELVRHLGISADRIEVIHHGVDGTRFRPRPTATLDRVRRRYKLARPFIFYTAALDGRKNHQVLVEAFVRFAREVPERWDLVLAGPGAPWPDLMQTVAQGGLEGHVHFLGLVPPTELPFLYSAAAIFAFPSLYEGFGNPVLEAMASGVPVLAARATSVPEVAGDAALLVDPRDVTAWGDALIELVARPGLRAMLRDKGLARARHFSWQAAARRLLACYRGVMERPPVATPARVADERGTGGRSRVEGAATGQRPRCGRSKGENPMVIAVIGCGRAGLPLALALAGTGVRVIGVEADPARRDTLAQGRMPFAEKGTEDLLARTLGETFEVAGEIGEVTGLAEVFVVAVNTPLDERMLPDVDPIEELACAVLSSVCAVSTRRPMLIIRSTVPPGFSRRLKSRINARLALTAGEDFDYAYCPDRVAPGQALEEIRRLPQIIGAFDRGSAARARELFSRLGAPLLPTTPLEAELAKLFNNAFRYVSFALANECLLLADAVGADAPEAFRVAGEGYPRGAPPRPGFTGGPCLFKDGFFLSWELPGTDLLLASWKLNEGLPDYLVRRVKAIRPLGRPVVLGTGYKEGNDDLRFSPGERLIRLLRASGADPVVHDPVGQSGGVSLRDALSGALEVFVAVPDPAYRELSWEEVKSLVAPGAVIADPWLLWGQASPVTVLGAMDP